MEIDNFDVDNYIKEIFAKNGPDREDYQFFYELVDQVKAEDVDSFRQKITPLLNPDSSFFTFSFRVLLHFRTKILTTEAAL